jgi:pimeloyl-ACP methyl ester carboxylesterase
MKPVMHAVRSVILLPGLHGSTRLFGPFVAALQKHAPDLTPLPLALPDQGGQDYPTLIAKFREQLCNHEPFHLLAESYSTPLALNLAAMPQLRVASLTLVSGFCRAPHTAALSLLPLRPLFAIRPPKAAIRHILTGKSSSNVVVTAVQNEAEATGSALLARRVRIVLALDPEDCPPPRAEIPVLLLQAQYDAILPWETQAALERALPAARVVWLDGPHLLLQVCADACAQEFARFLASQ